MTEKEIHDIVARQRKYFQTGATLPPDMRIQALRRLYAAVFQREKDIQDALKKDLGKSSFEGYMCEPDWSWKRLLICSDISAAFPGKKGNGRRWPSSIPEAI